MERTSAQRAFGQYDAWVQFPFVEKPAPSLPRRSWWFDVPLVAAQGLAVPGSRRSPGKRGVGKREAQELRWCRCHGADLSAAGFRPVRCSGSVEKAARFVPWRLWWFDVLLVAAQGLAAPGSRRSPGKRGVGKRGAQELRWCGCHGADLSAAGFQPTRCPGALEKPALSVPWRPWWFDVPLVAAQGLAAPGSRRSPGKRGVGKRGAQEPRWCRCHGADLSAAGFQPTRCPGALEKPALSVPWRPWRLDVLLVASPCSVAPGSRPSSGRRQERSADGVRVSLRALLRFPRESGGPGAAVGPLPQSGPQCSGLSAGMMLGVFSKDGTLRAAEAAVV